LSELAGLAVTPDGRTLAISTLSDCANGRAGPALIEIVSVSDGTVLHSVRLHGDYPLWLSWTAAGTLVYQWHYGVWAIPAAAAPGGAPLRPRPLVTGHGRLGGASEPMIAPGGSVLLATVSGPGGSLRVAGFSALSGLRLRVLISASGSTVAYCGPLWASADGQHVLAACGDGAEVSADGARITPLRSPWRLPSYAVPGPPQIAW